MVARVGLTSTWPPLVAEVFVATSAQGLQRRRDAQVSVQYKLE